MQSLQPQASARGRKSNSPILGPRAHGCLHGLGLLGASDTCASMRGALSLDANVRLELARVDAGVLFQLGGVAECPAAALHVACIRPLARVPAFVDCELVRLCERPAASLHVARISALSRRPRSAPTRHPEMMGDVVSSWLYRLFSSIERCKIAMP